MASLTGNKPNQVPLNADLGSAAYLDAEQVRVARNIPLGYGTGSGGAVTQATSKSTGVTLNTLCGQITMNNAGLNDATTVSFTLTNSQIATTDCVIVNVNSVGTVGAYIVNVSAVSAGSCSISVRNVSGGTLSEAIVLNFAVIKSVA